MEVVSRKKRPSGLLSSSAATAGALSSHSNSHVSAYEAQVRQSMSNGLSSSSTRRSLGGAANSRLSTLSMYNVPPQEEITLDQFERAGVDRLQALKTLESIRLKKGALISKNAVSGDTADTAVTQVLAKYNLENAAWDNLSHFVLRLAYCKTEELRRWLITQESALFKYRFDTEPEEVIKSFLANNEMNYVPLTERELDEEVEQEYGSEEEREHTRSPLLRELLKRVPYAEPHNMEYFKVPFEDAIDLLRDRKVYLADGYAYVSRSNLSAIITTKFRAHLSLQLSQTARATAQIKQDVRIQPLVGMMAKQYITPMYKSAKIEGAVTKDQLPLLAERSFPLCMSSLFGALKAENHLKHGGRMQLGLFLKGIGLSLADALAFWKSSFARRTPPEKFDKEYAYNIRHNYGKEGKRTTYTPYGCVKIIQSTPGPGDHHGCPFRQFDEAHLKVKMKTKGFTPPQMDEVLGLVKGNHFQIACQRFFQYTHGGVASDAVGNHPNAYFDASENWYREQQGQQGQGQGQGQAGANGAAPANGANGANGNIKPAPAQPYNAFVSGPTSAAPAAASNGATTAASSASPSASSPAASPSPPSPSADSSSGPAPMDIVPEENTAAAAANTEETAASS